MDSETENSPQTRAIEWHIRLRDGDDTTWKAFAEWLAQNPVHLKAYEAIEQTDIAIEPLLPKVVFSETAQEVDRPTNLSVSRSRRWWVAGGALAASVATLVTLLLHPISSRYEMTTLPGQRQTVTLDANTQVILNGSTRVIFDRNNPRFASLASGEALFRVHHDERHPFTLEVGSSRIEDVGTVFDVVRDQSQLRVAVGEGKVAYRTQGQAIALGAGQALSAGSEPATARVSTIPTASVGAWQKGRLLYSGEPLSQVAADLGRSLGVHMAVSPIIENRPFSGAIVLDGTDAEQLERLKAALNVNLEAGPTGWTLTPLDDGRR